MIKLKTVLVDDEQLSKDLLQVLMQEHAPSFQVVGEASNIIEGLELIKREMPDILFLDVEMEGGDGFELMEQLEGINVMQIVLVTAHEKYARKAIRTGVFDFLLKPIDEEEFKTICQRLSSIHYANAKKRLDVSELEKKIILPHHKGFDLIELKDIIYFEASNNYTNIYLAEGRVIVATQTLSKFEKGIISHWFLRIHRSYIINLFHLKQYLSADGGYVSMANGKQLSVSGQRLDMLENGIRMLGERIF